MGGGWSEGCFGGSCCCPKPREDSRRKCKAKVRFCRKKKKKTQKTRLLFNYQGCEVWVDDALCVQEEGSALSHLPNLPVVVWLHKSENAEPEVAMPTCILNSPHLSPVWTMRGAWRSGSPLWNDPPAAKALLHWWSRLKNFGRCVYSWPSCCWWATAPVQLVCSTSASLSRVLYLWCLISFQVFTGSTEPVLSLIKGITGLPWICVPAFLSVALK